jgi:hypothetical protein
VTSCYYCIVINNQKGNCCFKEGVMGFNNFMGSFREMWVEAAKKDLKRKLNDREWFPYLLDDHRLMKILKNLLNKFLSQTCVKLC